MTERASGDQGPSGPLSGADQGAASAELVLATPALLFLLMLVVQFGLWYHASHVASAAAQEAAAAARVEGGTEAAGEERGRMFLRDVAGRLVPDARAEVERGGERATATVTGHVVSVVPFMRLPVRGVSEGPVERFQPGP